MSGREHLSTGLVAGFVTWVVTEIVAGLVTGRLADDMLPGGDPSSLLRLLILGIAGALVVAVIDSARSSASEASPPARGWHGVISGLIAGAIFATTLGVQRGAVSFSTDMEQTNVIVDWAVALSVGAALGVVHSWLTPERTAGLGVALLRGTVFGFVAWVAVAVTFAPLLADGAPAWSRNAVTSEFPTLPGFVVVFGASLALVHHVVVATHRHLFEQDLRRVQQESLGARTLRATLGGALAGLFGGVVFASVMVGMGFFPEVGSIVGLSSTLGGFVVHLAIAQVIGATFGLLFREKSFDLVTALGWGTSYGAVWWFLGPLTLLPLFLTGDLAWTAADTRDAVPALIAHLAYGAVLGATLHLVERRHNPWWVTRTAVEAARVATAKRTLAESGQTLWLAVTGIAFVVPFVLAA